MRARPSPGGEEGSHERGLERRLRRLDRRLGIDHSGRSEWVWAVPALAFVGTLAMLIALDLIGGGGIVLTLLLGLPLGLICAAVMAGLSIAYMTPADEDHDDPGPPRDHDPEPIPPPGWWGVMAADRAPDPAERSSEARDKVAT
ncbi:MAG: hypothetical protein WCB85_13500 [Candidatus Dormiibacterota bacterium]